MVGVDANSQNVTWGFATCGAHEAAFLTIASPPYPAKSQASARISPELGGEAARTRRGVAPARGLAVVPQEGPPPLFPPEMALIVSLVRLRQPVGTAGRASGIRDLGFCRARYPADLLLSAWRAVAPYQTDDQCQNFRESWQWASEDALGCALASARRALAPLYRCCRWRSTHSRSSRAFSLILPSTSNTSSSRGFSSSVMRSSATMARSFSFTSSIWSNATLRLKRV